MSAVAGPSAKGRRGSGYPRFVGSVVVVSFLLVAAGWLPAERLGGPGARAALVAGCGISLLAAIVGGLAAVFAARRDTEPIFLAFAAMGVRLAVVVLLGAGVVRAGWFPTTPLLLWTAVSYLAMLALETRWIVRSFPGSAGDPRGKKTSRVLDGSAGEDAAKPRSGEKQEER